MTMKSWGVVTGVCVGVLASAVTAVPALAVPAESPYPDISQYSELAFDDFQVPGQPGVWFSTPFGLNCGIRDTGSFGCNGAIPGGPPGTNQIGWSFGDDDVHFDSTDQPQYEAGAPQRVLPRNSYIEYGGTKCATTPSDAVYCTRYNTYEFMVSPSQSWLQ